MADALDITVDVILELIKFDFDTGKAYWKNRDIKWFNSKRTMNCFNKNFAGKEITSKNNNGYVRPTVIGNAILLHRLIWLAFYGKWPEGQIDHINGIRDDNRIENLREVSHSQNMMNQRIYSNNTSGVTGVIPLRGKWQSEIRVKSENIYLGYFDNFEDAVAARKAAEIKYGFHPNHGMRL